MCTRVVYTQRVRVGARGARACARVRSKYTISGEWSVGKSGCGKRGVWEERGARHSQAALLEIGEVRHARSDMRLLAAA